MNAYADYVVNYLFAQSWQIAILVGIVGLLSFVLRNRSAHVRYLLWLIILARCLVPPFLTVPLAVLPERPANPSVAGPILPEEHSAPEIPVFVNGDIKLPDPAPAMLSMHGSVALLWTVGVAVFLLWAGGRAVRYTSWLHRRRRPLPPALQKSIRELSMGFKFRKLPKIWLLEDISQPFVWGLLRGSVYLPADFVGLNGSDQQRSILAHELSHVARLDAGINLLQVLVQAAYWFHPLVWWTNRKLRQEREKCCDEMAVAHLNAPPEHYTEAIVDTLAAERRSGHPIPSLAIVGSVRDIEERIRTMLKPGKRFHKRPSLVAATVVLLIALVTIPTALVLTARGEGQPTVQSVTKPAQLPNKPAADNDKPEQPRLAARTFNSEMSLTVAIRETPTGEWRTLGRTPSAAPIAIPACYILAVFPTEPVKDWDLLDREISRNGVNFLSFRRATDADAKHLAGLTGLLGLDLCNTKITDGGLAHLKGLTGLRELLLYDTQVTDVGLEHLKALTALRQLWLDRTQISDAGLERLRGLSGLLCLKLDGTLITDSGLKHLQDMTGLQTLSLDDTRIKSEGLAHLKGMTKLQNLYLRNTQITDTGLPHLKGLTTLLVLDLRNTQVTDVSLEHLKDLTALRELLLDRTLITDSGLGHIKGMSALQWLGLSDTQVTDAGLPYLAGLTRLDSLNLSSTKITDAGLGHLQGLTGLQDLRLSKDQITDAGLQRLRGLSGLRSLYVDGTQITDSGLEHLKDMTRLQGLGLENTRVKSEGLAHLKGLTKLQYLYLGNTQIADKGLPHLTGLIELQDLHLNGTQVTDGGLAELLQDNGLPRLQVLSLSGTKFTDAGLTHLSGLKNLQNLYLSNTRITDAGLANLKGLTELEGLDLSRTGITDAGLAHLKGLTGLDRLFLTGTQVTDEGVRQLKQSLPTLTIERGQAK